MSCLRRPLALLVVLLASGGLSACGIHHDEDAKIQKIEGEGFYLSLGELKYQVQGSRQLNPDDIQDKALLAGVPAAEQSLEANEVWFGVFMQVENESSDPLLPAGEIEIVDTQEDIFEPVEFEASNPFAYRAEDPIEGGEIAPVPDTPGFNTANQGSLLLFKLTLDALDNRPLELKMESSTTDQTGIIDLDV
ncbi:MAG: hypothetical protein M3376_12285 [Actinomycetota bacterium]|nr:hypothetical protein [Actinomycetota bacterium]